MQLNMITTRDTALADRPVRRPGPAPLCRPDAVALFAYLDDALQQHPCSHSFRNTEHFLGDHHLDVRGTLGWLRGHGVRCDCEVLGKFEATWRAREYLAGIVCRLPKNPARER